MKFNWLLLYLWGSSFSSATLSQLRPACSGLSQLSSFSPGPPHQSYITNSRFPTAVIGRDTTRMQTYPSKTFRSLLAFRNESPLCSPYNHLAKISFFWLALFILITIPLLNRPNYRMSPFSTLLHVSFPLCLPPLAIDRSTTHRILSPIREDLA